MLDVLFLLAGIVGAILVIGVATTFIQLLAVRLRTEQWHIAGEAALIAWAFVLDLYPKDRNPRPTVQQINRAAQFVRETVGRQVPESMIYNALYSAWLTIPRHRHRDDEEGTPIGGGGFGEGWTQ